MNSDSVHLIATDPPFNKGRDFHATPDSLASGASFHDRWSWEKDVHEEWVDQITDDWPLVMNVIQGSRNSYGDDMGAFLCYMAVRLIEMRRVLRDDGSVYLHCDPTASHYLKELMDAVFGKKNFRNEIVWSYRTGGVSKRWWSRKHDVLLFYVKSPAYQHHPLQERVYYNKQFFTDQVDENGRFYADVYIRDVWDDIKPLINVSKERTGYATQKPLGLYGRIIEASSSEGDIVLDPFAGCATTCVAAERLGRQWVGIDIWDKAHEVVTARLEKEGLLGNFGLGGINYTKEIPERTDDGQTAGPFMLTPKRIDEPKERRLTRAEMVKYLLEQDGQKCRGCDREFDDPRYLELDHNTPRSDGGWNHISNRILLCGPCNKAKSNIYTLSGLRRLNKKNGWMINQPTKLHL